MSATAVEVRGLWKVFGPRPAEAIERSRAGADKRELQEGGHLVALRDVSLAVPLHGVQVVMGPSGSGKSTLVRHVNRLIEPTAGEVLVLGENALALGPRALRELRQRKVSMVFQRFALLPHRTAAENVAYGLAVQGVPAAERRRAAERWLARVGLEGYEGVRPGRLSGGQMQRVGLARALATDAEVLLMDEPFSALDPLIRTEMQDLLVGLQRELHKTVLFITHDLDEALRVGDRVTILREGEVVQDDEPERVVLAPANEFVREFTRGLNRGRLLTVGALVAHGIANGGGGEGAEVPSGTPLEDAIGMVVASPYRNARVTDEKGATAGTVSLQDMMRTLVGGGEGPPGS